MLHVLFAAVLLGQSGLTVTLAPTQVATIDLGKINGTLLCQFAWSPDGTTFYLQTCDEDRAGLLKASFHYLLTTDGAAPKSLEARPIWAEDYWTWKSAQTAPRDPGFKIDIESTNEVLSSTAHPMAGDLALGSSSSGRGVGGVSVQAAANAARDSQPANIYRMMLNGQIVGEWINHRTMPGVTFGWGPLESGLIAYTERLSGALVIMDKSGSKQKIDGTKDIVLPAFNADGKRLAYLADLGHHRYAVMVATIVR